MIQNKTLRKQRKGRRQMERLQKYMAACGVASRRKCEELILCGRVAVNGIPVSEMGMQVEPGKDRVTLDGKEVLPPAHRSVIMLNKPDSVMSTAMDPEGRETVVQLVPSADRLYPVGRLDYHTEGLILLTNDGEIANRLTHPRYEVEKEYVAVIKGKLERRELLHLQNGVEVDGEVTAPAKVKIIGETEHTQSVSLIIHEGRNRQIRKMLQAVGKEVLKLTRVRMGDLFLGHLKPGEWRVLNEAEMQYLNKLR